MRDKLINKKFVIIAIALVFLLTIGFSYAWWRLSFAQDKANTAVSKCLKLELANQANEINLTNMYPISDEEGRALTPLTFTLKNTCSMSAKYTLNLEMLEGTTLNSNYLAVLVNNKDIKLLSSYNTATTVVKGSMESRTLDTGILAPNGSKDYSISIWMDKSVTLSDDAQNKVFKSKVVVDAVATETAMDKIIASVDTTGKCPTVNDDGTVNVTSAESENSLLCMAPDAYGTSYYYRGNVQNNYVKFANFYWRIIRVNGDGSVRMIYDGTLAHTNGEETSDRDIGGSQFNEDSNRNAYIGYMYGNYDADTYAETHANINDSTIKKYVDSWYENNLKNTNDEQYLADNIFCNDRSITQQIPDSGFTNTGIKAEFTKYRWYVGPWTENSYNPYVSFFCNQLNDAFTVSDITKGNGALKYPIAIVNADELVFAGAYSNISNKKFYLFSGAVYWVMSPPDAGNWANSRRFFDMMTAWYYVSSSSSVRPVINLKPNSLTSGDGTINNPYTVE